MTVWNKGLTKADARVRKYCFNSGNFQKGQHTSSETEFIKGSVPPNKKGKHVPLLSSSPSLAYILGVLLGDGCVYSQSKGNGAKHWLILSTIDIAFADSFASALEAINIHSVRGTVKPRGNRQLQYAVTGCNSLFCRWFKNLTLEHIEKRFLSDEEKIKEFVRGFYESEGHTRRNYYYSFCNTNREILELVQRLLGKLAIQSTLHGPYHNGIWRPRYNLYIPATDGQRFISQIQPLIKRGSYAIRMDSRPFSDD